MRNFLLINLVSFLIISKPAFAEMTMYLCQNESSAMSCSSCNENGFKVSFKVNEANQVVIQKLIDGNGTRVSSFEGCKVVDKNNWVCEDKWSNGNPAGKRYMSDGVFTSTIYSLERTGRGVFFSCAK